MKVPHTKIQSETNAFISADNVLEILCLLDEAIENLSDHQAHGLEFIVERMKAYSMLLRADCSIVKREIGRINIERAKGKLQEIVDNKK